MIKDKKCGSEGGERNRVLCKMTYEMSLVKIGMKRIICSDKYSPGSRR